MKLPTFTPLDNLRGFVLTRPPAVVFTLCLMLFAITLISLAYYVKVNDLENPDITKDWNAFLKHFTTKMDFCIDRQEAEVNSSSKASTTKSEVLLSSKLLPSDVAKRELESDSESVTSTIEMLTDMSHNTADDRTGHSADDYYDKHHRVVAAFTRNHSFPITISIEKDNLHHVLYGSDSNPQANGGVKSKLVTALTAAHLKLKGVEFGADAPIMNVTFTLLYNQTLTHCLNQEQQDTSSTQCLLHACVTFTGPANLFPDIDEQSFMCHQNTSAAPPSEWRSDPVSSSSDHITVNVTEKRPPTSEVLGRRWCARGSRMWVEYVGDPQISVMLDVEDRSLINLHLMHTSYFVFVMIMTVFCFAIIRGSRPNAKIVIIDKSGHDTISNKQ